jgi:hypothetical protein
MFLMGYFSIWQRLSAAVTGAAIILLLLMALFVNVQIQRDN